MHRTRLLVAVFALPLLYVWIKYFPPAAFLLLAMGGILLGQYEFYRLYHPRGQWGWIALGLFFGAVLAVYFYADDALGSREVVTALLAATLIYPLARRRDLAAGLTDAAVGLLGVFYVGWFLGHLILLRNNPGGENLVLFLVIVTWAGDTGAYYSGKSLGRHKLAPKVSPNK
ncbi:MAG TPA: phosphatidate cytidylyltransferase, partial [Nitrospiria bacterium]